MFKPTLCIDALLPGRQYKFFGEQTEAANQVIVWDAGLIQRVHRTRLSVSCHKYECVGGEGTRLYRKQNK